LGIFLQLEQLAGDVFFRLTNDLSVDRTNFKTIEDVRGSVIGWNALAEEKVVRKLQIDGPITPQLPGYLHELADARNNTIRQISPLLLSEFPSLKLGMERLRTSLRNSSLKWNKVSLNKAINQATKQLLGFIVSDTMIGADGINYTKLIRDRMQYARGKRSTVANTIIQINTDVNNPLYGNMFLNILLPSVNYRSEGYDTVKFKNIPMTDTEIIALQQSGREVYKESPKLIEDLIELGVIQASYGGGGFDLLSKLPPELVFNYTKNKVDTLVYSFMDGAGEVQASAMRNYKQAFIANNPVLLMTGDGGGVSIDQYRVTYEDRKHTIRIGNIKLEPLGSFYRKDYSGKMKQRTASTVDKTITNDNGKGKENKDKC